MKHQLWITIATYIAYCIDKELCQAIDLKVQVEVLMKQQEKQPQRILLDHHQRIRNATRSNKSVEKCWNTAPFCLLPTLSCGGTNNSSQKNTMIVNISVNPVDHQSDRPSSYNKEQAKKIAGEVKALNMS